MRKCKPLKQSSDRQAARRARMAHEIFKTTLEGCESFRDREIGVDLAYLMGAILDPQGTGWVDWTQESNPEPPALLVLLKKQLPKNHAVWAHIVQGVRLPAK